MALSFNFTNVENYKEVTTHPLNPEEWHPVADALIWLSMICGYSQITNKNVDTIIARILAYQAVRGAYLHGNKQPLYITADDVRRFVGMRTNATAFTDAQWTRKLGQIALDHGQDLQRRLQRENTPSALQTIKALAEKRSQSEQTTTQPTN
jgi:hypothetical protein